MLSIIRYQVEGQLQPMLISHGVPHCTIDASDYITCGRLIDFPLPHTSAIDSQAPVIRYPNTGESQIIDVRAVSEMSLWVDKVYRAVSDDRIR